MNIKTRFAPSPTGDLHIGNIRTALYSWLFARHHNGKFILRIEDTDLQRSKKISINSILNGLKWLGLNWDEGPYFQTHRLNRYQEVIENMLKIGIAYKCVCSLNELEKVRLKQIKNGDKPRYPGICRDLKFGSIFHKKYVIRFKNPLFGKIVFHDQIKGRIIVNNSELDDLVIQRSNGLPTYNFCVVIDDLDMNITHVIRGDDHLNNTPRQINILNALGAKIPTYAHVSMILDQEGSKISKRKNTENINQYYNDGFLPEALLNYVVRLGWSYGNQEIFNISEMQKLFTLSSLSKSSSMLNKKKLLWLNKYYLNNLPLQYVSDVLSIYMKKNNIDIKNGPDLKCLVKIFRHRYHTLKDMHKEFKYFYEETKIIDPVLKKKYLIVENYSILKQFYNAICKINYLNESNISKVIDNLASQNNILKKEIIMVLRVALTGNICSPNISTVIYLLGKDKTCVKILKFLKNINNVQN